jgi:hypothetical protein
MAEFIGKGDWGTARYIYLRTLLLQTGLATLATSGFLFWVLKDAKADYRLASALMVLSIWPSMVNSHLFAGQRRHGRLVEEHAGLRSRRPFPISFR